MVTWWSGRYSHLTPRSQYSRSPSQFFLQLLRLSLVFSILCRVREKHKVNTLSSFSGLGTFLAAFTLMCGGRSSFDTNLEVGPRHWVVCVISYSQGLLVGLGTAFLQAVTSLVIVGWFWSIM